jgi:hypothetical protein
MGSDLTRLVAACERKLLRTFIEKASPTKVSTVNWALADRQLAIELTRIFSSDGSVWPQLQNIESLAMHGGKATVRSVLYRDQRLRDLLDSLDASDETAALWLALTSEPHFQYALSALHADRGLNKRSWKAFRAPFSPEAQFRFDDEAQERFEQLVRDAIGQNRYLDAPGRLEVHHFNRVVFPEHSHSQRDQDQVTVYAEMRNVTEEIFNEADEIETRRRKKIDQISVVFDRARRELDVVSIGGKDFLRNVAHAFCRSFSDEEPALENLIRRPVNLQVLACKPPFPLDGQDLVKSAYVDEIRLRSATGWLCTFERKSRDRKEEDVYDWAAREFGEKSPFKREGYSVEGARIRLDMEPEKVGHGPKVRVAELKPNGRTNLREHEDNDRFIANELLVKWGILEPESHDED